MTRMKLRKNLGKHINAALLIVGMIISAGALADTRQVGFGMMGGYGTGWMGGYGGSWVPILLIVIIAGIVGWLVGQKGK